MLSANFQPSVFDRLFRTKFHIPSIAIPYLVEAGLNPLELCEAFAVDVVELIGDKYLGYSLEPDIHGGLTLSITHSAVIPPIQIGSLVKYAKNRGGKFASLVS